MPEIPPYALKSVSVERLFGKYDFEHVPLWGMDPTSNNVAFLYGDNGVGKTTLLRLIYSTLSSERDAGHRGFLARTKFKTFSVEFGDGQTVSVRKQKSSLVGEYRYICSGPRSNIDVRVTPSDDLTVTFANNPKLLEIDHFLRTLTGLVFINDQRHLQSSGVHLGSALANFDDNDLGYTATRDRYRKLLMTRQLLEGRSDLSDIALEQALKSAYDYMLSRAVSSSSAGDRSANQVYLDVIRAIAGSPRVNQAEINNSVAELLNSLSNLQESVSLYEKFGILSNIDIHSLISVLESSESSYFPQIVSILSPYVRSLQERVTANQNLLMLMDTFERTVNKFLRRKRISLHLSDGIRILDDDGNALEPSLLSSGEQHLLFLVCSALAARDQPTIILVDEPELSLNYKWQRDLTPSLTTLAGPMAQFIMATHSFEIISGASSAVVPLDPQR